MVFAANKPVRIFGEGVGRVRVEFLGNTYSGYGHFGKWEIELPAHPYGGPYEISISMEILRFLYLL